MKRFLITTADEATWVFDRPVVLLGEWCRRYDRRAQWATLDAVVARPYGVTLQERQRDIAYVQDLALRLLPDVAEALNALHGIDYSCRQWLIVLGHWLQRYSAATYHRFRVVEQTLAENDIELAASVAQDPGQLVGATSDDFIWSCNDTAWNQQFFAHVLQHFDIVAILPARLPPAMQSMPAATPSRQTTKERLRAGLGRTLALLAGPDDAMIVKSYLPTSAEALLQLRLGQAPQFWNSPRPARAQADLDLRASLVLSSQGQSGFEGFVRGMLFKVIPTCFIESFAAIGAQAKSLRWPSTPRFIFTSNSFDTDEVFKRWTAEQVGRGVPYITGQHGNNYGAHLYFGNARWPERAAPEAFLTWGWKEDARCEPAFLFKTVGKQPRRRPAGDQLLLIQLPLPHMIETSDTITEHALYQDQQFDFYMALPQAIRAATTVRLHGTSARTAWNEIERWQDRIPDALVEPGRAPLADLIKRACLVVHSYDSTGIIETLAFNIPTVAFWRNGLDHLLPEAKPFYEALQRVGVIQPDAHTAASHIAAIWGTIDEWWSAPATVEARGLFLSHFGLQVDRPISTLAHQLTTLAARPGALTNPRVAADEHP